MGNITRSTQHKDVFIFKLSEQDHVNRLMMSSHFKHEQIPYTIIEVNAPPKPDKNGYYICYVRAKPTN